MRLTNTIRDSFIRAAMHDVPKEDFDTPAQKAFEAGMQKIMPKEIADIVKKGGKASEWICMTHISTPSELSNYYSAAPRGAGYSYLHQTELWETLKEFSDKKLAQQTKLRDLERKLHSVAYACTTRKQLCDALPEFEKYLPEDEAKAIRTLPVVTNVVADFVKAGWPTKKAGKK